VTVGIPSAIVADASQFTGLLEHFETDTFRSDGTATTQTVSGQRSVLIGQSLGDRLCGCRFCHGFSLSRFHALLPNIIADTNGVPGVVWL
jgi:hypothetical protein